MLGREGFIQGYNAQVAVDADAQIVVAHRLSDDGSDQDALLALLDATAAITGQMLDEVSADAGFCPQANLQGLIERTVRGYVATGRASRPGSGSKGGRLVQPMRARIKRGGIEVDTDCENTSSNPSSDRSSRPEASDGSSFAASTR